MEVGFLGRFFREGGQGSEDRGGIVEEEEKGLEKGPL